jgi:hypothetical protein
MLRVLGYIWSSPITLLGLLVAVVGWSRFHGRELGCLVLEAKPGGILSWFFRTFAVTAFTWGAVVIFTDENEQYNTWQLQRIMKHESRHLQQAMVLGPFMPIAYGIFSLVAMVRGKHPYRDNFLEVDAYLYEREVERGE